MTTTKCQCEEKNMYKNKNDDGSLNISGKKIAMLRKAMIPKTSQRMLADMMQLNGIDMDKNAIQKIESGKRFVTDIELRTLAKVLQVSSDYLLEETDIPQNNHS